MEGMEEKLGAILGNPQMMQQIMSMAQTLGASPQDNPPPPPPPTPQQPSFDAGMIQKIAGLARQSGIDKNQQNLLRALGPYLSRERIAKLEKAMRAAKIAAMASSALGTGGNPFQSGR